MVMIIQLLTFSDGRNNIKGRELWEDGFDKYKNTKINLRNKYKKEAS